MGFLNVVSACPTADCRTEQLISQLISGEVVAIDGRYATR